MCCRAQTRRADIHATVYRRVALLRLQRIRSMSARGGHSVIAPVPTPFIMSALWGVFLSTTRFAVLIPLKEVPKTRHLSQEQTPSAPDESCPASRRIMERVYVEQ